MTIINEKNILKLTTTGTIPLKVLVLIYKLTLIRNYLRNKYIKTNSDLQLKFK